MVLVTEKECVQKSKGSFPSFPFKGLHRQEEKEKRLPAPVDHPNQCRIPCTGPFLQRPDERAEKGRNQYQPENAVRACHQRHGGLHAARRPGEKRAGQIAGRFLPARIAVFAENRRLIRTGSISLGSCRSRGRNPLFYGIVHTVSPFAAPIRGHVSRAGMELLRRKTYNIIITLNETRTRRKSASDIYPR